MARNLGALDTDIYAITAEDYSRGRSNLEVVPALIRAGVRLIQYREKEKSVRAKYYECLALRELTAAAGVALMVNDQVDLALAVGADGVHLGQDDLPAEKARDLVGEELLIGLSTHSPEQARAALKTGAVDYIGVGPLFATSTKKDVVAPVGLGYLDYVVENIPLPFVAIGGIKEHNIAEVRRHGARLIAMVTEIVGAPDIEEKIRSLRVALATS
ncbi:MAG: thiamine phosphate synthase [Clostridia bacterium]|nr:MAG: thiamine phosphate synthase [Clostridia bacterium]